MMTLTAFFVGDRVSWDTCHGAGVRGAERIDFWICGAASWYHPEQTASKFVLWFWSPLTTGKS